MGTFDAILVRAVSILLIIWAIWFTRALGIKPQEIGQAVKTFNANFGPKLPERKNGQ